MPEVLLQAGFDISVPETTTLQYVVGTLILIALIIALTLGRTRISYWGLPAARKRVREAVRGQLEARTPAFAQFRARLIRRGDLTVHDVVDEIDALLDRGTTDRAVDRRGWIGTVRRMKSAVTVEWHDRLDGIPQAVLAALRWAVLTSLFGAVVVSTAVIVSYLGVSPDYPTAGSVVDELVATLDAGAETTESILTRYPYAGTLWGLAFAYSILAAEWLYEHWYAVPSLLLSTGATVWVLQTRLEDVVDLSDLPDGILGRPRRTALLALAGLITVWAIGAGVATVGHLVGTQPIPQLGSVDFGAAGDVSGLILSLLVGIALLTTFLIRGVREWQARARRVDARTGTLAAYQLARRSLTLESSIAAGLVVLYFVAGVVGGDFVRVVEAFLAASLEVKTAVGVSVLALLAVSVWQVRAAAPAIRSALSARLGQSVTKGALVLTSLPWFALVVFYLLAWAVLQRVIPAVVIAILAGLLLRRAIRLGIRATHAARLADVYDREPVWVGARVYDLPLTETADQLDVRNDKRRFFGDREKREAFADDIDRLGTQYLADIGGHRIAHPDRATFLRTLADAVVALAHEDDPEPTVASWHAKFLVENGITDPEETTDKLRRRVMKRTMALLRSEGPQVPRSRLDEQLDPYPDDVVDDRLADAWYIRRDDRRVVLREDVPAKQHEEIDTNTERRLRRLVDP